MSNRIRSHRKKKLSAVESLEDRRMLSTSPPVVADVFVSAEAWQEPFLAELSGDGYSLLSQNVQYLPWTNADQISIQFNEDVQVQQSDLIVQGVNEGIKPFQSGGFEYESELFVATWTFDSPLQDDHYAIRLLDRIANSMEILLDGDGDEAAGGDFLIEFDSLPGDGNQSGVADVLDGIGIRQRLFSSPPSEQYDALYDFDGSGQINVLEGLGLRANLFNDVPREPADLVGPIIDVELLDDTAPLGLMNSDNITSESSISGTATDPLGVTSLTAKVDGAAAISIPIDANGSFEFDPGFANDGTDDGSYAIEFIARDGFGNTSTVLFEFTHDTTPPIPRADVSPVNRVAFDSLDVSFDEPVANSTFDTGNFAITVVGGPDDGQIIPIASVVAATESIATLQFGETLPDQSFQLQYLNSFSDVAGNVTPAPSSINFTIADPTGVASLSPANGEEMVNVARETILRFDEKVDPTTITTDSLKLIANGQPISGRIRVSSTERFATFFYDEPLPASTEVRVLVDGDQILGRDGIPIDADGDDEPGGDLVADFRTLPLSLLPRTELFGFVRDSQTQEPLEGVTISLEAFPEVNATTDSTGFFELGTLDSNHDQVPDGLPAPEFFAYIDGSNVISSAGVSYASLGKNFHTTPGQRDQLNKAGDVFDIFLPSIANDAPVEIVPTLDTEVRFGLTDRALLQSMFPDAEPAIFEAMRVTIPAGSAVDDEGQPVNQAFVVPVDPEFLPAPLPPNLNPRLVVSIQTPGAENFDVPASVTFPNLDGLAPGEQMLLFSFDHDLGAFVVNGTATVSADGSSVTSDPGVGILAPGWHFTQPGSPVSGNVSAPPVPDGGSSGNGDPGNGDPGGGDPGGGDPGEEPGIPPEDVRYTAGVELTLDAGFELGIRGGFEVPSIVTRELPNLGDFVPTFDLNIPMPPLRFPEDPVDGEAPFEFQDVFTLTEDFENGGFVDYVLDSLQFDQRIVRAKVAFELVGGASLDLSAIVGRLTGNQLTIRGEATFGITLTAKITDIDSPVCDIPVFGDDICEDRSITVPLFGLPTKIQVPSLTIPLPVFVDKSVLVKFSLGAEVFLNASADIDVRAFLEREEITPTVGAASPAVFAATSASSQAAAAELVNTLSSFFSPSDDNASVENVYYRFLLDDGNQISGRTDLVGSFNVVLPSEANYELYVYEPLTNRVGMASGETGASGELQLQNISLSQLGGWDQDGDGVPSFGEFAVGTDAFNGDSDGDGIDDGTELQQGLDPLDDRGFPTGIVSTLQLAGETVGIEILGSPLNSEGQTAYLATGSHGMAILDASDFGNPIVLGQLALLGSATDIAVDPIQELVAVATGNGGLQIVDVRDSMSPFVVSSLPGPFDRVEVVDGIAFASAGSALVGYDLVAGQRIEEVDLGGQRITDIAKEGNVLYTMDEARTIRAIDISGLSMVPRGATTLSEGGGKLFVGNGIAYAAANNDLGGYATADVTDIDNLVPISGSDAPIESAPGTALVTNGSGLGLLIGQSRRVSGDPSSLTLIDTSDPANTFDFVTRIDLPVPPNDIAIASGIAFLADNDGLKVINYLPFDNQSQPPTVSIQTDAIDVDPATDGTQVEEGTGIPISVEITDDVQVRNVELLVEGVVVLNDVSFPFDLRTLAPNLADGEATSQFDVQVRATDTGGNSTVSDVITLNVIPDITPPQLVSQSPQDGGALLVGSKTLSLTFDEGLDIAEVTPATVQLVSLSSPGTEFAAPVVSFRNDDRVAQFTFDALPEGDYEFTFDESVFTDRAGNQLGTDAVTVQFEVVDATAVWTNPAGGNWNDLANWRDGVLPGPDDGVLIVLNDGAQVSFNTTTELRRLTLDGNMSISGGELQAERIDIVNGQIFMRGGKITNSVINGTDEQPTEVVVDGTPDFESVTLNADLEIPPSRTLVVSNGLTINGELRMTSDGNTTQLLANGTQTIGGTGQIVFAGTTNGASNTIVVPGTDVLTMGADLTIRGGRGRFFSNSGTSSIQILGTLSATIASTITLDGNATDISNATIEIEVDQSNSGLIEINGSTVFGGSLSIITQNDFSPTVGDEFRLITFTSSTGQFSSTTGLDLGAVMLQPVFNPTDLTLETAQPLRASTPNLTAISTSEIEVINQSDIVDLIRASKSLWGNDLRRRFPVDVNVLFTDLPNDVIGLGSGSTIWLDSTAGGLGWYVDSTPLDNSEFLFDSEIWTATTEESRDRIDLLTVLTHELGHLVGLDDVSDMQSIMFHHIKSGERRLPSSMDVDDVFADDAFVLDDLHPKLRHTRQQSSVARKSYRAWCP
ncbi:Ig-like domain-containing protein [Planctomycetota bacterium]